MKTEILKTILCATALLGTGLAANAQTHDYRTIADDNARRNQMNQNDSQGEAKAAAALNTINAQHIQAPRTAEQADAAYAKRLNNANHGIRN